MKNIISRFIRIPQHERYEGQIDDVWPGIFTMFLIALAIWVSYIEYRLRPDQIELDRRSHIEYLYQRSIAPTDWDIINGKLCIYYVQRGKRYIQVAP